MSRIRRNGLFRLLVLVATVGFGGQAYGYSTDTHKNINESIFYYSDIAGYFQDELKISIMGSQTFQGKTALILFKDAGEAEDSHWGFRYRNHYHDPTQTLFYAGLKDSLLGWSNLEWAQLEDGNGWTWQRAYDEFLAGLTAPQESDRKTALGDLFTTLGHLTHLVADMASPAHVRDDAHPRFDGYILRGEGRIPTPRCRICGTLTRQGDTTTGRCFIRPG